MKIGAKIYYEKNSGNIIIWQGDLFGDVVETSIDQDFENYEALKNYNKNAVGLIQLEYGELDKQMAKNKANRFKIDISGESPKLVFFWAEIDYYGEEIEIEPPKSIEEKFDEKLIKTKAEIIEAVIIMTMSANKKMHAEDVPPLTSIDDTGMPADIDLSDLGNIDMGDIPKLDDPSAIPPPPVINK